MFCVLLLRDVPLARFNTQPAVWFQLLLTGRTGTRELDVSVDSRHLDWRPARPYLRVEILPVELAKDCNVGDVGVHASVDARHIQIGVQVLGKEELYAAVHAADVNATLAELRYRDLNAAVDSGNVRITQRLRDVDFPIDAAQAHCRSLQRDRF